MDSQSQPLNTNRIKEWRSIVTLIVFVFTNVLVLHPVHVPFYIPTRLRNATWGLLSALRVTEPRASSTADSVTIYGVEFVRYRFPLNFVTAPLIADLFLLAILAIGRQEVHDGTVGSDNIFPLDIMAFFLTLAYIAISIDASGLIRYLAFRVLKWGGKKGHRLYFYLYTFFFSLASFIGNDPIILSGTAFLAYLTRVSSNIVHPRAWIHTQFAVANIGSAIMVSSNPTNLVLAGAFKIRFVDYTANMIVPAVVTAIVLFPFLLYVVFPYEGLIPEKIEIHEAPTDMKDPVNPNIPFARERRETEEGASTDSMSPEQRLSLEEIMNPFLDRGGAAFGAAIMAVTLVTILGLNAATEHSHEHPVYWVTLPAAFVMLCWDLWFGWHSRDKTRVIAREGRKAVESARKRRALREAEEKLNQDWEARQHAAPDVLPSPTVRMDDVQSDHVFAQTDSEDKISMDKEVEHVEFRPAPTSPTLTSVQSTSSLPSPQVEGPEDGDEPQRQPSTLQTRIRSGWIWSQETFPTVTAVLAHLPFKLIPFALCMFVLVQALATKGWVAVFAWGWDHWVDKTGTIGAVGGMGFLSVIMCNFAGTNIGTTILLCRVIQDWGRINEDRGGSVSSRTFWATVYSMALGVNYGAFSTAFSASLAGLLWRDILRRKDIYIKPLEFARVNFRIIAVAMVVGSAVLVGEVYITRHDTPYDFKGI